jgi:uncharacterized protein YjbI with pentapeptide repeats
MQFSLATIVEPVVWQRGTAHKLSFQSFISANELQEPPKDKEQPKNEDNPPRPELGMTIQAGRLIDGLFEDICVLDTRWVGVRAARLVCYDVELIGCECVACDLSQSVWVNVDARQLNLTGSILSHALLHRVRLHRANLRDADLSGAVLEHVKLRGADLRNCNLAGVLFDDVDLRGADLRDARVDGAVFRKVNFDDCRGDGVNWNAARIMGEVSNKERDTITSAFGPKALPPLEEGEKHLPPRIVARSKLDSIHTSKKDTLHNLRPDTNLLGSDLRAIKYDKLLVSDCQFGKADMLAARLNKADFTGADLHGADLRGAHLEGITFQKANLRGADLRATLLSGANLEEADLTGAELRLAVIQKGRFQQARLRAARLRRATLADAQLHGAELSEVDVSYANLERTQLQNATLFKANLQDAQVQRADLTNADLRQAVCDGADFTGATLADETLASAVSWRGATLPDGIRVPMITAQNRAEYLPAEQRRLRLAYCEGRLVDLQFNGYDLLGAQLLGDFFRASFNEATLDYSRLPGAFSVVDFTEASLVEAHLSGVFTASPFDRANLTGAMLNGIFSNCSFKGAELHGAASEGASLVGCDFTDAHIDETVLQRAQRLRGCTLPDGTRYDGRYNLPGDRQDAANYRYSLNDPDQWAEFYGSKHLKAR